MPLEPFNIKLLVIQLALSIEDAFRKHFLFVSFWALNVIMPTVAGHSGWFWLKFLMCITTGPAQRCNVLYKPHYKGIIKFVRVKYVTFNLCNRWKAKCVIYGIYFLKCKFLLDVSEYPCHKIHHVAFKLVSKRCEECNYALCVWTKNFLTQYFN